MPQNSDSHDRLSDTPDFTYRERLNHWAIVQIFPDAKRLTVARFRRRADADGHLRFLRQSAPDGEFVVIFEL